MRQTTHHAALFAALTLSVAWVSAPWQAHAQNLPGAATTAPSGATSTSKGLAKVVAGVKAYRAGKMDTAISTLTQAMRAGGLSSTDLAKALYYRGLAYRRNKQPAEAIADLTSAIWLKRGLTGTERADAEKNRTAAYREAGIQDPGATVSRSAGPPSTKPATAPGGWQTATQPGATSAPATTAARPQATAPGTPPAGNPPGPTILSAAPNPAPSAPSSGTTSTNPLAGVGTFFSNLFTSGPTTTNTATNPPPVETTGTVPKSAAATPGAPANPALLSTPATGEVSAVSGWSSNTQVSPQKPATRQAATRKPAPQPRQPQAAAAPSGRYSIRVAALRSQDAAQKLVAALQTRHAKALGGRTPRIETETFGNMGTFYNVQVGPFARPKDYAALCTAARSDGFDCQVIKK